jgi:mono/diheme cytochrome c family protein
MQLRNGLLLACLCLISACSTPTPTSTPITPGDANGGRILFEQGTLEIQACATCHSIDGNTDLLGPTLKGIATTAASRVSGQSADDYLIASMRTPNAYLVSGYAADLMPALKATDQQYGDVLAYLLTLK